MPKAIIRLLSFFGKEVNEVRRQPRLVLSLILGPFLILLLFGVGYTGDTPVLRTVLVVPPEAADQVPLEEIKEAVDLNFDLVEVVPDQASAMDRLIDGEIDVVEILPADVEQRALTGRQAPVEFKYNEINPMREQWIQYLAYAQINEVNNAILRQSTREMQQEAESMLTLLRDTRTRLDALESGLETAQEQETQQSVRRLKEAVDLLSANPLLASRVTAEGADIQETRRELTQLRDDLDQIDRAISSDSVSQQEQRIEETRDRITRLEESVESLATLPPEVIVSPLQQSYENIRGQSFNFMTYYAPSVLALIIQHIAVTLGALSLVRDRLLGAIELYRVAPVSMLQVLIGKYLGYTLFIAFIFVILVALLYWGLGVPLLGSMIDLAITFLLVVLASLSIGFFISAISTSDGQAVQLSMLVLLTSMFFSGFFLQLENFWAPVRLFAYTLPLTHAIEGFQASMLRGIAPGTFTWSALSLLAAVTFAVVAVVTSFQFRRATL